MTTRHRSDRDDRKLGVTDRTAAAVTATQRGLL
jgi:DNA-binding NarL/FixJ family response regulator